MISRPKQPLPEDIRQILGQRELKEAYAARPAYQQNDYLSWITRAKLGSTRQKRLDQMLHELEVGGVYMNMPHEPSRRTGD